MPDISVHRDSLLSQAQFWDTSSGLMGIFSVEISGAQWTGDPGIFASVTGPYNQVCQEVARWCGQGQIQMEAIASALVAAARNYHATESANTQLSSGIHS